VGQQTKENAEHVAKGSLSACVVSHGATLVKVVPTRP
jgi:hypothetical protein